ncbi:hypothetical protein HanPI659440_Chr09g0318221 [Helianthus annuus]|nr:hypothetical protein HanPI659440_Chr09g0318221 [Helianthus annuus]
MHRIIILYFLNAALSLDSVFTYLIFNRASLIRDLLVPGQLLSFNQIINLIKKWESSSSKFLLEVTLQKSTGKLLFAEDKGDFVDFLFGNSSWRTVFHLEGTPLHYSHKEHGDPRKDGLLLKRPGLFIITDDLTITPSSSNSTISTLSSYNVSFDDVEKHEISIGLKEGLRMLKASLRSCLTTLTDSLKH